MHLQLPHIPASPTEPRWRFVASRAKSVLRFFILADATQSYMHWNPLFALTGTDAISIAAQGPIMMFLNIAACGGATCWTLSMVYNIIAVVSVTVGFYEPGDFPPLFGLWRDAYTLRRFWG